jgi:hypothetical protein
MIRLFAIFALSLLVCNPGQTQSTKDEIHLRVTVRDVVPLSDFSGKITPVDFDPRFALTVRIESVGPAVGNFPAGTVVALAIHSPALVFGDDATKGKTYDFSIQRKIKHGKTRYFGLKVETVQTAPVVSAIIGRVDFKSPRPLALDGSWAARD